MNSPPLNRLYTLDAEHRPVPEHDLLVWGCWIEKRENCVVEQTNVGEHMWVSTVFLGLDHSFGAPGPPILFETMIFCGDESEDMWRYSTWDDAVTGHAMAVKKAKTYLIERSVP